MVTSKRAIVKSAYPQLALLTGCCYNLFFFTVRHAMAKILLIEDDLDISRNVKTWLSKEHHVVDHAATGELGLELFYRYPYDLLILDWNLPDMEGPDICKAIRQKKKDFAVLFLTSRAELKDKITGLDAGAFDYVVKPSTLEEIAARVRSLLRRVNTELPDRYFVGDIEFNHGALELSREGITVQLTQSQSDILNLLARGYDTEFSAQQIMEKLWSGKPGSKQLVKVHVMNLRKKLAELNTCLTVATSKGGGYKLGFNSAEGEEKTTEWLQPRTSQ
jgi:two-component system, OmpR family, response regulator